MEAIILSGGMGTRLQSVVRDMPKAMAPVAGQPFLYYLLQSLERAGFKRVIFAVGYQYQVIEEWLSTYPTTMCLSLVIENEPLGTGGAVKQALDQAKEPDVFVLNGDTFFPVDYATMLASHRNRPVEATLALKAVGDASRYGLVEQDVHGYITRFHEKRAGASGLINGGVYLIRREALQTYPDRFSLEKEYFEQIVGRKKLGAFLSDRYFLDIGIPEDYLQAQTDFADGTPYLF